jgi:hypothetical protein
VRQNGDENSDNNIFDVLGPSGYALGGVTGQRGSWRRQPCIPGFRSLISSFSAARCRSMAACIRLVSGTVGPAKDSRTCLTSLSIAALCLLSLLESPCGFIPTQTITGVSVFGPTPGGHLASSPASVNTSIRAVPAVRLIEAWTASIVIPSSQSGLSCRTGSASIFQPASLSTNAICSAVREHSISGGYLKAATVPLNCFNRSIASCWFSNQRGDSSRSSLTRSSSALVARSSARAARSFAWATSESASSLKERAVLATRWLNQTSPNTPVVTSNPPISSIDGRCQWTKQSYISLPYSIRSPAPTSQPNTSDQCSRSSNDLPSPALSILLGPLIRRRGFPPPRLSSPFCSIGETRLARIAWLRRRLFQRIEFCGRARPQ